MLPSHPEDPPLPLPNFNEFIAFRHIFHVPPASSRFRGERERVKTRVALRVGTTSCRTSCQSCSTSSFSLLLLLLLITSYIFLSFESFPPLLNLCCSSPRRGKVTWRSISDNWALSTQMRRRAVRGSTSIFPFDPV